MSINSILLQNIHKIKVSFTVWTCFTIWYDFKVSDQARRHVFKSGPAVFRVSVEGTSGGGEHERGYRPSRKGVRGREKF